MIIGLFFKQFPPQTGTKYLDDQGNYNTVSGAGLTPGTALQLLQTNAGATATEWVTTTGTGAPVRAVAPTFSGPVTFGTTPVLLIASGGVISFNSGDVTITHSANLLNFAGASSGYNFDALVYSALAGVPCRWGNTSDAASVQAGIFEGDRATMADNDEAYLTLRLSNDAGTQTEFARITWVGVDVNAGTSEDGAIKFSVMVAGTLATKLYLDGTSLTCYASTAGGTFTITADTGSGSAGDAITVTGGTGDTNFAGGAVIYQGGAGAGTGAGGACTVRGGSGVNNTGGVNGTNGGAGNCNGRAGGTTDTGTGGTGGNSVGNAGNGGAASGAAGIGGVGGAGDWRAGNGGASSDAGGGNAGLGGDSLLRGGNGGAASGTGAAAGGQGGQANQTSGTGGAASGTSAAGNGGAQQYTAGSGGSKAGTGNANGGAGGQIAFNAGSGGNTASNGANAGGAASAINLVGAAGGNATAGTGDGGAGTNFNFTPGAGGTSSGGAAGAKGAMRVNAKGFVPVSGEWDAASVDKTVFVCSGTQTYRVTGIIARVTAAGTDAGAVTLAVRKSASGTTVAGGTLLHSGTANLKGTADTNQTLTLSATAADLLIAAGDAIGLDFTGVMTAATGVVTIMMEPTG